MRIRKRVRQERKMVKAMKKIVALLTTVMILTGSVGMTASAATTDACDHPYYIQNGVNDFIETYTHSVRVGTSTSGKPVMAVCLVEIGWREYKMECTKCRAAANYKEKVYEVHSMH
ncbi:MAG: hypothetical protein K2G16_05450 [Lachnospiraceae bacterium]|nr:hypothetical protein [Lachnospiraceae bacterium]